MSAATSDPATAPDAAQGPSARRQVRDTLLAAVPPFAVFSLLHAAGAPDVAAYLAGAALPAGRVLIDLLRRRTPDAISAVIGLFLAASLAAAALGGDAATVMSTQGGVYAAFGVVFGVSRLAGRPLMRVVSRYMITRRDPAVGPRFDERYARDAHLRSVFGHVTTVWAAVLVVVGIVAAALALTLPLVLASATQMIGPLACVGLGIWSTRRLRREI